jgi:hypothetical protein
MNATDAYRLRQHLARDHALAQEDADNARRARRRTQWPEARADLMRRWLAAKRLHEDRGEPFVMGDPPPMECPDFFFASDESPREIIEPPTMPASGIGAKNHDGLGRYVGPAVETRNAEQQLKDAQKKKGFWR